MFGLDSSFSSCVIGMINDFNRSQGRLNECLSNNSIDAELMAL